MGEGAAWAASSLLKALAMSAIMTIPLQAAGGGRIWLQAFGSDLEAGRAVSFEAGGAIAGRLRALPGGEFAAIVEPAGGRARIVRWDAGGREVGRVELTLLGKPRDLFVRRDGSAVVVTSEEVALVGAPPGEVRSRRALRGGTLAARAVEPGETGAWLAYVDSAEGAPLKGRLVYAPLEGEEVTRPLPVMSPPSAACEKEYPGRECPWTAQFQGLVPTETGGCVVAEGLVFYHAVGGANETRQLVLTELDAQGGTRAARTLGEATSSLEWFGSRSSPGNFSIFPGKMFLVRRSYHGYTAFLNASTKDPGDLLVLVTGTYLKRLGSSLEERWSRFVQPGASPALSPAWARGVFLFSGDVFVQAFDEGGGAERVAPFQPEGYRPSTLHNVVGQTAAGEWLLASY